MLNMSQRLETILIVVSVEQTQLWAAVNRIERVVDIEHNTVGNLAERRAIKVSDHQQLEEDELP
jgi:hypothetical protein